jgi:DNA-binding MarR family transcriptional regulator
MPTEPTRDLSHQVSRAERLLSGRMSALLASEHCTLEEWRVLKILSDGEGHIMTEIADFALLPAPTLTKLMDRMVAAGLVYRRADERDRRRVLAYLGEHGRTLYERAAELVATTEAEISALLGDADDLSRWLVRLADILAAPASAPGSVLFAGVDDGVAQVVAGRLVEGAAASD